MLVFSLVIGTLKIILEYFILLWVVKNLKYNNCSGGI